MYMYTLATIGLSPDPGIPGRTRTSSAYPIHTHTHLHNVLTRAEHLPFHIYHAVESCILTFLFATFYVFTSSFT